MTDARLSAEDVATDMTGPHYGLKVMGFGGEDYNAYLTLGHHPARRALAAFNHYARTHYGLADIIDSGDTDAPWASELWIPRVRSGWGVFRRPDPALGEDPGDCWYADFRASSDTPGAIPVTWLDID